MQVVESFSEFAVSAGQWPCDETHQFSFRELVEQAQTGMFVVQDEMLRYANPKLLDMVGLTRREAVDVRKASSIVHPKDRARFEQRVRERFDGIEGVAYEVQCERADGSLFDARVYGRLVSFDGRPADLITFSDVTDLTQATEKLKQSYMTSIKVFSNLVELRGGQLIGHGRRVADMARAIALEMQCSADDTQEIFVAGLLHDIGMIGLSDASLGKPVPKLSAEELDAYKGHCATGEHSLMALVDLQPVARLIRSHHERFDGGGFPDALCGADIPLGSRIIAVADAYDDLLHGHMGARQLSISDVKTLLLHATKGSQFDPGVVDAFMRVTQDRSVKPNLSLILDTAALRDGMVLAADLVSPGGVLMLTADHVLTDDMIQRIRRFEQREGSRIEARIKVLSTSPSRTVAQ